MNKINVKITPEQTKKAIADVIHKLQTNGEPLDWGEEITYAFQAGMLYVSHRLSEELEGLQFKVRDAKNKK